jgi:CCR4-NOT complex subunit CAF16
MASSILPSFPLLGLPMAIEVKDLYFHFGKNIEDKSNYILKNINLTLPHGSKCLLVGLNGAGKSSLLKLIAGKHLISRGKVTVYGNDAYNETPTFQTFLGTDWIHFNNSITRSHVDVCRLIEKEKSLYPERVEKLVDLLDIDVDNWKTHKISEGERRRVQILMGLAKPFKLLLLDEVTMDLDVLVRKRLLKFLKDEDATIIYATHIFDGLGNWPSHIIHLFNGEIVDLWGSDDVPFLQLPILEDAKGMCGGLNSPLLYLVEKWMEEDHQRKKSLGPQRKSETNWDLLAHKKFGDKFYNYWE